MFFKKTINRLCNAYSALLSFPTHGPAFMTTGVFCRGIREFDSNPEWSRVPKSTDTRIDKGGPSEKSEYYAVPTLHSLNFEARLVGVDKYKVSRVLIKTIADDFYLGGKGFTYKHGTQSLEQTDYYIDGKHKVFNLKDAVSLLKKFENQIGLQGEWQREDRNATLPEGIHFSCFDPPPAPNTPTPQGLALTASALRSFEKT